MIAARINFTINILPYSEAMVVERLASNDHNKIGPVIDILPNTGIIIIENRGITIEIIFAFNSSSLIKNIFETNTNAKKINPPIHKEAAIPWKKSIRIGPKLFNAAE
jgi:hypothetical protein